MEVGQDLEHEPPAGRVGTAVEGVDDEVEPASHHDLLLEEAFLGGFPSDPVDRHVCEGERLSWRRPLLLGLGRTRCDRAFAVQPARLTYSACLTRICLSHRVMPDV